MPKSLCDQKNQTHVGLIKAKYLLWRSHVNCFGIVDDEEVAGKLFSFCYRVMYGTVAASDVVAERNSFSRPARHDGETTAPLSPIVRSDPTQDAT